MGLCNKLPFPQHHLAPVLLVVAVAPAIMESRLELHLVVVGEDGAAYVMAPNRKLMLMCYWLRDKMTMMLMMNDDGANCDVMRMRMTDCDDGWNDGVMYYYSDSSSFSLRLFDTKCVFWNNCKNMFGLAIVVMMEIYSI